MAIFLNQENPDDKNPKLKAQTRIREINDHPK